MNEINNNEVDFVEFELVDEILDQVFGMDADLNEKVITSVS